MWGTIHKYMYKSNNMKYMTNNGGNLCGEGTYNSSQDVELTEQYF